MKTPLPCSALKGKDGVTAQVPAFVAHGRQPGQSLHDLTKDALALSYTDETRERLRMLDRPPFGVVWDDEHLKLRDQGAAIRREVLAHLDDYLAQFIERVEAAGGHVHRAATAAQARAIITTIARDNDVKLAVKSKSMVTEEIELNAHLESQGIAVVETDLGEHIIQLRGERPSQLVGPATHLSTQDVADLFHDIGEDIEARPEPLAESTRTRLRPDFRDADMGITGVNFGAADTGTLVIVSNEGNVDLAVTHPRVHVAVMGMERLIPRLADIGTMVPLLCYAAADHVTTAYQTLITGPARAHESDGPQALHVVILDNGRDAMRSTEYSEALACIRCGNCQMSCPVFKALGGGHGYGSVYGGPIGAVISPLLGVPGKHDDLPFLCSLCGACADACPAKIPLPDLLLKLRVRATHEATGPAAALEKTVWRTFARTWTWPFTYRLMVEGARLAGRLVPSSLLARLPLARDWANGRALPPISLAGNLRRTAKRHRKGDRHE